MTHIKSVTKSAFFHIRNISRLHPSLSDSVAETLIHSFVTSRLDYCNAILYGVPNKTLDRLQHVQKSAATVLTQTKSWQHITPTLKQLHWLPVKFRITFKLLLLTYKSLHTLAPPVLNGPPPCSPPFMEPVLCQLRPPVHSPHQKANLWDQGLQCGSSYPLELAPLGHSPSTNTGLF